MNNKKATLFFCLIMVILLLGSPVFPQAGRGRGRIGGNVTDESGNAIASAKITLQFLEDETITREAETNKKGKWKIGGLGSGRWRAMVSAQGFIPYEKIIKISQLDKNPSVDIVLIEAEEQLFEDAPEMQLFSKGNELFEEEKFEDAIASYQEFLEKNPEIYQVHFNLGNCYKEMGNVEQALKEYQIILEKPTDDESKDRKLKAKALAGIGETYLKKDDLDSAQNYLRQSLELSPEDEILAYNVGEIYFSHQRLEEAIEYFILAAVIKPDWSEPYYKLGLVYLNKTDNANAIENLEKFLELEPDSERSANVKNIIEYLKKDGGI